MKKFFVQHPELKFLLSLMRPHFFSVGLMVLFALLGSLIALAFPFITKLQIDQLQKANTELFDILQGSSFFIFVAIALLVVFFRAFEFIFNFLSQWLTEKRRQKIGFETETKFFGQLFHLDPDFLTNPRNRRIILKIFDVSFLVDRVLRFIPNHLGNFFTFFGVLPLILVIDYRIGLFTLAISVVDYLFHHLKIKQENRITFAHDDIQQKMYDLRYQLLYHFQKILLIDKDQKVLKTYQDMQKRDYHVDLMRFMKAEQWSALFWVLENFTTFVIAVVFGYQVLAGTFTLGDYTMITLYALQLQKGFSGLFDSVNEWRSLELDFLRLGFFLTLKPRFKLVSPVYKGGLKGDIIMKNVSFRYPGLDKNQREYLQYMIERQKLQKNRLKYYFFDETEYSDWQQFLEGSSKPLPLVLNNFDIHLKRGELTALIGENGAGKTTVTHLILRNYEPEQGEISFGGVSAKHLDPSHLRKFVSIMTQDIFLIESFSIRDNLLFGVEPKVSDEKLWETLERFGVASKISSLPKKLDTFLGEDTQLSGGQRQLLVVARTFLQASPFIIFDEGTNQLDAEHEALVMDALQELKKQSTILMITHKLTSARKADFIYVLEKGKITQKGTHGELLQREGYYGRYYPK